MKPEKKSTIELKPLSRRELSKIKGGVAADDCGNCRAACLQHYPIYVCAHIMCNYVCSTNAN